MVLLPVLGFDRHGTRLGTGAGYYDRMFAFRRHRHSWHRPLLVGIAFQCQQLPLIERSSHDVPLDAVVTEDGISIFTPRPVGHLAMQHWLLKTEPSTFGVDDLAAAPRKTTSWDGVRNYQARNFIRDQIKQGR